MSDMKQSAKLLPCHESTSEGFGGFLAFDELVYRAGAIAMSDDELMAVAVTLIIERLYCARATRGEPGRAAAPDER